MKLYNHNSYEILAYLSHSIRVYCCGFDVGESAEWVLDVNKTLTRRGAVYSYGNEYQRLDSNELVEEMKIMEESTHGIFVFAEKIPMTQTLLLMGYSAMCQKMHGITFINTNDDDDLITDTSKMFNMHICTNKEDLLKYLADQWREKSVTNIILEHQFLV